MRREQPDRCMKKILLTQGQYALVDDEDFDKVNEYNWYLLKNGRDLRARGLHRITKRQMYMHRLVMNAKPNDFIDHINHDTLDNRKSNLRPCTKQQNCFNQRKRKDSRNKYKGVFYRGYVMRIVVGSKRIQKRFDSALEAAKEYDRLARKHFGKFAHTNFSKK